MEYEIEWEPMEMDKRRRNAAWALCALWMAVIFAMSAMTGKASGETSGALARFIAALVSLFSGTLGSIDLEYVIRKGAHLTEYAVLFVLYRRALRLSGARKIGLLALGLTAAYAATDELHQYFVPGRAATALDVMIDTCGALIAWGLTAAVEKTHRMLKDK